MMRFSQTEPPRTSRGALLRGIASVLVVWTAVLIASLTCSAQGMPHHLAALEGKLLSTTGDCPVVRIHHKDQPLSATTTYLYHTLLDKRLANREVRLEGTMKADGTFEVERLFTVKDGKLYRVRYFCKVCNIVALEPGNCVCCQQPTELQEIPVTDDNTD